ncbi:hypothetical protein ACTSKR_10315 [Chitinibacteraceae bacterium HSL-7]
MRSTFALLVFLLASTGFVQAKECRDIKNDKARELCYKQHDNKEDRDRDDKSSRNCSDLENDKLRRECHERQHHNNQRSGDRSTTESMCGAADSKSAYDQCMKDRGFKP